MHAALIIAAKDLRQRLRDRSAIVMAVVAPFLLAAIFAMLLPSNQGFHTEYAVVDLDGGPVSAAFVEEVLPGVAEAGFADLRRIDDRPEAARLVEDGEIGAAFVIPEGFSEAIVSGSDASISVVGNVDSALSTQIAEAIATSYAEEVNAVSLSVAAALGGFTNVQPGTLADLSARAAGFEPSIAVEELKALTGFAIGVIAMVVLIVASTLLLGADWGNPIGVGLLVFGGVTSATGVSAMAATLARTEEQASGWNAILAMSLAILGGTFFSLARAPEFVSNLSLITPHAWFLRGLDELASPSGAVSDVLLAVAVMVGIGIVTGGIGLMRARRLVVGR
jgi:ABC-2 type transport system permease protein